jgi:hypothetical protein
MFLVMAVPHSRLPVRHAVNVAMPATWPNREKCSASARSCAKLSTMAIRLLGLTDRIALRRVLYVADELRHRGT